MHPLGILLLKRYSHSDSFCTFSSESVQFIIFDLFFFNSISADWTNFTSRGASWDTFYSNWDCRSCYNVQ